MLKTIVKTLPATLFLLFSGVTPAFADDPLFGRVTPPAKVNPDVSGLGNLIGAIFRLLVIVAGIWALFNFIMAGYQFIQAGGDSKAVSSAWARIWQSLVGIIIVAASFLFAAIIGQIFFGDPSAILNPQLITK